MTESGETKKMSSVVLGDKIQSVDSNGNLVYSEVLMFMDREPTEERKFIKLTTEDGSVLTLTDTHLVHKGDPDCNELSCFVPSYAGNVEQGQKLLVHRDSLQPKVVVSVKVTTHVGVYAPLTTMGNLVVDGVLASCYAVIDSQRIAHAAFAPVRWWHNLKHNAQYILRTLSFSNSVANTEPRTAKVEPPPNGIHWYPNFLYSLARYILPSHMVVWPSATSIQCSTCCLQWYWLRRDPPCFPMMFSPQCHLSNLLQPICQPAGQLDMSAPAAPLSRRYSKAVILIIVIDTTRSLSPGMGSSIPDLIV